MVAANQPPEVRERMERFLDMVPATIQQSLRRPEDPSGRTVPRGLTLRSAADLKKFMPDRLPRYKAGDCPLPNSDLVLDQFVGMGGFGEGHGRRSTKAAPARSSSGSRSSARTRTRRSRCGARSGLARPVGTEKVGIGTSWNCGFTAHLQAEPICLEYEFVGAGDLAGFVCELHRAEKATPDRIGRIMLQLGEAVAFAHGLRPPIVHRDLKPANVLLKRNERGNVEIKVADFGIGGLATKQASKKSRDTARGSGKTTVTQAYTPLYASPEQRQGKSPDPSRRRVFARSNLGISWPPVT